MTAASKFSRSIDDILLDYISFGDVFLALLHMSVYMSILEIYNLLSLTLDFVFSKREVHQFYYNYYNPLQCSCLENPRDGGAWWATVYAVTQRKTRLKQLNSSSSIIMNMHGDFSNFCFLKIKKR